MKILNININDFGGRDNHREEYKKMYEYRYIKEWDKLDKNDVILKFMNCIDHYKPDIIILQEYDINSIECYDFKLKMEEREYTLESEKTTLKRPSMTVFFIKNNLIHTYVSVEHERNGRAYAINVDNIVIYGTHVPPKYDEEFWNEIKAFIKNKKCLLVGDFNTVNYKNMNELNILFQEMVDVWKQKGNNEPISIMGDYVIADKSIDLEKLEISRFDDGFSDHPGIVITVA